VVREFAEGRDYEKERESDPDDDSDPIDEGLTAGFTAQGFHGLRVDSCLQRADLRLLLGDVFLLIGNLPLEARGD